MRFFLRPRRPLDDLHATLNRSLFLGKILVADLLCQLLRNGVGRNAYVNTFAAHFFDEPLGIELQFFGKVIKANLRGNCHALLLGR
jgi:hypothetical protein